MIRRPTATQAATPADETASMLAEARRFLRLPDDASAERVRAAFAASLWKFWQFFFAGYRRGADGREIGAALYQVELCLALQRLVIAGRGGEQLARAYPREHAKSVFATLVTPLWAVLSGHRRFAYLFSDTETQAWSFLEDARIEVETNERLRAVYPDACGTWAAPPRAGRIVFRTGALIMAAGSGKSVRGARWRAQRPDLIVLDDVENDAEVENPARRRRKLRWYNKVVKKLGENAVFVIVGTILHAESFLARQVASDADVHPAVLRDANRQDLWRRWERILLDRSNPDRASRAREFYERHRRAMDAGSRLLWPARFSIYGFYLERAEDLASYLSERQNHPFDPAASWFPEDGLRFLEKREMPDTGEIGFSVGFWDPSRGTATGDTSSVVRLDARADGRRVVSWSLTDRVRPEEVIETIIEQHRLRPFGVFGVEKVGLSSYDEQLRAVASAAGVSLPVEPVTPSGRKELRIRSLRPLVVAGTLEFAATLPAEAVRQLRFYPQHPNDDFPDAVQQAIQLADRYLQRVEPAGATYDPGPDEHRLTWDVLLGPKPPGRLVQ